MNCVGYDDYSSSQCGNSEAAKYLQIKEILNIIVCFNLKCGI